MWIACAGGSCTVSLLVANSPLEVSQALIRLSVGVEHVDDLVADVIQALDRA